jgi:hypothetical protein
MNPLDTFQKSNPQKKDDDIIWYNNTYPESLLKREKRNTIILMVLVGFFAGFLSLLFILMNLGPPYMLLLIWLMVFLPIILVFFLLESEKKENRPDKIGMNDIGLFKIRNGKQDFIKWEQIQKLGSAQGLDYRIPDYRFFYIKGNRFNVIIEMEMLRNIVYLLKKIKIEIPITKDVKEIMKELGYSTNKIWLETIRYDFKGNIVFIDEKHD